MKRHRDVNYNVFKREILATGNMKDYISIYQRTMALAGLNDLTPTEPVTLIWSVFSKMQTIQPTERFDGVNITDRPTHRVYIPFYAVIYSLDKNSLFLTRGVKISTTTSRYFKLVSIENYGEQDEYIVMLVKETGFTSQSSTIG